MPRSYLVVTLPFVLVGALQLVSCTPGKIAPPKPGGVYLSVSGGARFDQSAKLLDDQDNLIGYIDKALITSIYRAGYDADKVFLTAGSDVFVSDDDGESWHYVDVPLVKVTAFVSLSNGVWLASGTNQDSEGIVVRSLDKGESWAKVLTIPSAPPKKGRFFQIIKPPPPPAIFVSSLVPDPFQQDRVYATTSTGEVLAGEESGKLWYSIVRIRATKTDPLTGWANVPVKKIIPSPHSQNEVLLIGGDGSLVKVKDDEQMRIVLPRGSIVDVTYVKQFPEALLASLTTGIFVSRDGGENWDELNIPISKEQPYKNFIVRVSPTNPDRILVAVSNVVYRSEDGGYSWHALSLELPDYVVTDISINPNNAARVLLTIILVKT